MKKRLTMVLCAVIAAAMLAACGAAQDGSPRTSDDMIVVADIDGQHIYMYELTDWLEVAGLSKDILLDESLKEKALDYFIDQKVIEAEIKSKGHYDKLTEEQIELAQNYAEYDIQVGMQNSGMTEEEVLEKIDMTKEDLIERYKVKIAEGQVFDELVGDVEATEEEIKAEYDKNVAQQKELMDADPAEYVTNAVTGATIYYKPAGVRMVRRILIPLDEKWAGAIDMLRSSGYDDQAAAVRNEGLTKIQLEAEDALAKLELGKSFDEVLAEHKIPEDAEGSETAPEEEDKEEFPVAAGSTAYPEEFTTAAMALTAIGEYSGLVVTDEGYQILLYSSDLKQGAEKFDSVKDIISANIKPDKQAKAWEAKVKEWWQDHKVVCYYENLPTEFTEPEATPSATTD